MKKLLKKLRKDITPPSINWVTSSNERLASRRMRIDTPCRLLNEAGKAKATVGEHALVAADVNFFSKHFDAHKDQLRISLCETITGFDICDDHFDREHGGHYLYMLDRADIVTCNTKAMQERIHEVSGRIADVTKDPVTFPWGEFQHSSTPKYLWFGNSANIFTIIPKLPLLPNLTIISNIELENKPPHVTLIPWQPGLVERKIGNYDVVLLPRNNDPWTKSKSPNRAIDAIASGRFVITDFPEIYGELASFCFTGSMKDGMIFYREHPETCQQMVKAGQEYIKKNYSDEAVLASWLKAFNIK